MIVSLSWKNIWRNKGRSLLIIVAVSVGISLGSFINAFQWGIMEQRINTVVANELSHIQIHRYDFDLEDLSYKPFEYDQSFIKELESSENVKAVSERMILGGMISSARGNLPVRILAVNPEKEGGICNIQSEIIEGSFFNNLKKNEIVIGEALAKKLGVKMKSKLIIHFHDEHNEDHIGAFRVVGIYEKNNDQLEKLQVYVNQEVVQGAKFLNANTISEIAVLLKGSELLPITLAQLKESQKDLKVQSWAELMPELANSLVMFEQIQLIIMAIVMLALAFGIVNTMMMAVLERTKEIGMLMAIGVKRLQIGTMFFLESLFLSLIGLPFGLFITYLLSSYFGSQGINLEQFSEGINSFGFDSMVYPIMKKEFYLSISGVVFFISMIASLFPFFKAIKQNPVEALKTS
jgi:ABC-type lipoprotein release transport system permease subunit